MKISEVIKNDWQTDTALGRRGTVLLTHYYESAFKVLRDAQPEGELWWASFHSLLLHGKDEERGSFFRTAIEMAEADEEKEAGKP